MYKKRVFLISLLLLIVAEIALSASAMETGYQSEPLTEERRARIIKNLDFSPYSKEPFKYPIVCFDVNENGDFAVGSEGGPVVLSGSKRKRINVYSRDGTWQYGFSFSTSGSYDLELNDDHVIIHYIRSDLLVCVDRNGQVGEIREALHSTENTRYKNEVVESNKRTVGSDEYRRTGYFYSTHSRITLKDASGTKTVVYNATVASIIYACSVFALVGLLALGLFVFVKQRI